MALLLRGSLYPERGAGWEPLLEAHLDGLHLVWHTHKILEEKGL